MPISHEQFLEMVRRVEGCSVRSPVPADAVEEELPLHFEIMKWCKDNRAAYIHARPDKKSGINPGAPDFTILHHGKLFLVECKTRTGKRSIDQLAWALLAEMNGFIVRECRSFSEFLSIIDEKQ